ncbi:hypothetical protein PILCRDRAFT_813271 [Piloderma croceum F 1598]|uniref:Bud22 domain-containing protein n=1 Tax=Piloderma croceum (strain F 1598) TaxID=765440 RepID=A0A0C3FYQ5_PILCF|nr:hypothetical protein PILCRDRAFT_813271 [Piloderma croceum F 1598]
MADVLQRGIKRKRQEPKEVDIAAKIVGKLHHDLKEIRKAAKKTKAFETQKLVKKLKGLRIKSNDVKNISDCEAQLDMLKRTDHEPIAHTALTTKLKKDRLLSENSAVQAAISAQLSTNLLVPAVAGTPLSKVQSRLLSSKILATEVAAVIEDLKLILQPKSNDTTHEVEVHGDNRDAEKLLERPKKAKTEASDSDDPDEDADELEESDKAGWESGVIDADEEVMDGWESGSVRSGVGHEDSSSTDNSGTEEEEDSDEENEKPPPRPTRKESAFPQAKSKASAAESTFLPSLSVGFIRGDSDSEWSDSEAKTADIRKNRRGQRARRAIWEKKYGKNANHTKKQREEMEASGRGRKQHPEAAGYRNVLRKGSSDPGRRGKLESPPQHHQQVDAGWGQRNNSDPSSSSTKPVPRPMAQQLREERPLHPSWEAKKKQKEKQSAGILPPQGKKIKF